jgi:hypothetical protein
MILGMALPDQATLDRRAELKQQRAQLSAELAHIELRLAADILRHIFGTAAVWLIVDKDSTDGIDTDINLMLVKDADHNVLWFNSSGDRYDCNDYPGAHDIADDHGRPTREMDGQTQAALIKQLTAAYDAVGGVSGALFVTSDEHFGFDYNLLCLSIPAAFDPYQPDNPDQELEF